MKPGSLACFVLFLASHFGYGWGNEGHQAIGITAAGMLSAETKAHVATILGNDDLGYASTWLDDARNAKKHHSGPLAKDAEAKAFNSKFPKSDEWHYVNLPVGSSLLYSESSPFASANDVVHAIKRAVDVLEGNSVEFTPSQALRIIIHLVGDVHQPLHTIAGYYDVSDTAHPKLITDPKAALGKPQDRGGNQLFYTKTQELHALWDTKIVAKIAGDSWTLAEELKHDVSISKWKTTGDYHTWPGSWIGDTALEAGKAYQGIQFGAATVNASGGIERIDITLPGGTAKYKTVQEIRAKTQLVKASVHLAQLLNSIRYK